MLVTFRVKNIVSFCVKKLLHFALKSCYILRQKLLHFGLMLHFTSKVVTFRVYVTFCVNCYILRRNRGCTFLFPSHTQATIHCDAAHNFIYGSFFGFSRTRLCQSKVCVLGPIFHTFCVKTGVIFKEK